MNDAPHAFAQAAEALVATPFRLHGRDPATGLDCVGLVHASLAAIGRTPPGTPAYALRQLAIGTWLDLLPRAGFVPAAGGMKMGDLVLCRPGPGQFHLLIVTADGSFIHAHAGLGRVVRTPAPLPWPIAGRWHLL